MLKNIRKQISKEIKSHAASYFLLTIILIAAFFVRIYRVGDLLGFYYDQGRDALVIWKLWHEGKPFLIGPVTGLQGIFLGPFYYYLISPFYLIGGGNPVYPAVFLSFLSVLALFMLYVLGKEMHSRIAGIIAVTIGGFSYYLVLHGRWLSNPNPILLSSTILLYSMWKIIGQSKLKSTYKSKINMWWVVVALMVGLSLQFESASGVFYMPIVTIFLFWQRKKISNKNVLINSFGVFLLTLLPQILFNFRHDNLLFNNFSKMFFQEKAFKGISAFVLEERFKFFWEVISNKFFAGGYNKAATFIALSFSAFFVNRKSIKKGLLTLFTIFFAVPFIGYIFFQGNYGNLYDYYLSGYYLPFILLFAIGLGELWKTIIGKLIVLTFLAMFLSFNQTLIKNYLTATSANRPIVLEDQLLAADWVYNDAKGLDVFNLDIYVPPVIPHAYEILIFAF